MKTSGNTSGILDLWELRFNQRNERCLRELPAFKQASGIPLGPVAEGALASFIDKQLEPEQGREERMKILLLHGSLLRTQGRMQESARWGELISRTAESWGVTCFFALFERAIGFFARGDSHSALEFFAQASRCAPSHFFELNAQINTLLCLENLALPYAECLARVRELMNELAEKAPGAKAQVEAFDLRQEFRHGRFERFSKDSQSGSTSLNQAEYFRLWVRQLPYHSSYSRLSDSDLRKFGDNRDFFYQNSFRLRTLQGMSHPSDWETLRPSEFAHRLYLWVWKWLEDPSALPVKKVIGIVTRSNAVMKAEFLDRESQALIRNALLWLSLFDPSAASGVESFVEELKASEPGFSPLLALESDLIGALTALRDEGAETEDSSDRPALEDWMNALESNPLWGDENLHFHGLLEAVSCGKPVAAMAKLGDNLSELMKSVRQRKEAPILVDVSRFRIVDSRTGVQIISEPMTKALDLLQRKGSVPVDILVLECFGIRSYDSLIHQTKVNNLLQRLKHLCGDILRFRTKSGVMLAEGSWDALEIVRPTEIARKLTETSDWKAIAKGQLSVHVNDPAQAAPAPSASEKMIGWSGQLSRGEVERRIQRPRSTTNRLLANWEKSGKVTRFGSGRAVRYRWNSAKSELRMARV